MKNAQALCLGLLMLVDLTPFDLSGKETVAEAVAMVIKEGEPAVAKAKALVRNLTEKYSLNC